MDDVELRHDRVEGEQGVQLHVARAGEGPPVVLLHGFPENWASWRHQIEPLVRAGFSVHAADLRGYGLSDQPAGRTAYRLRHLVQDVAGVVRATGQSRAHVVGHDWGGVIAWAFATVHPELLDRLAILNAPHPAIYARRAWRPPQLFKSWYVLFFQFPWLPEQILAAGDFRAVRAMFEEAAARSGAFSAADIDGYVTAMRRPGALTAALNYYRANRNPFRASNVQIEAETLVIWGERDPALSTRLLDGIERVAPKVNVVRLSDAGHWVQNEAPEQVNRALIDFLRG